MEEEYRKKMIKQKREFEKWKKKEGDSDLVFNERDNKKKNQKMKFKVPIRLTIPHNILLSEKPKSFKKLGKNSIEKSKWFQKN